MALVQEEGAVGSELVEAALVQEEGVVGSELVRAE